MLTLIWNGKQLKSVKLAFKKERWREHTLCDIVKAALAKECSSG